MREDSVCHCKFVLFLCLILGLSSGIGLGASVVLEWDANPEPDIAGYNVYRSDDLESGYAKINGELVTALAFTDPLAQAGKTYSYVATAVNQSGLESAFSTEVSVQIPAIGKPPQAISDSISISEDEPVFIDVLSNDTDPDGDPLTIIEISELLHGSAVLEGQLIHYWPDSDYSGTDSFSYVITDGNGSFAEADVTILILPVNDPPTAHSDVVTTAQGMETTISVLENDTDPDGDVLSIVGVSNSSNASLEIDLTGTVRYGPNPGFTGQDSFQYTITDGQYESTAAVLVNITALEVSAEPLIFPASIETGEPVFEDTFVGIGLLNLKNKASSVFFHTFDGNGAHTGSSQMQGALPPRGQMALLSNEATPFSRISNTVLTEGAFGELLGFFMVGDSRRLDGVGAQLRDAKELHFPVIKQSETETTLLYLMNRDDRKEATVDLTLHQADGTALLERTAQIPPLGSLMGTLSEIMAQEISLDEGFLKIRSSVPVRGFSLISTEETFLTLQGQIPSRAAQLLAPHFVVSPGPSSTLRVLVRPNLPTVITIRAFDDDSNFLAEKKFNVSSESLLVVQMDEVLGLESANLSKPITGFLEISTRNTLHYPEIAFGTISFSGATDRAGTMLPLISEGSRLIVFPHLAQARGTIFTGLSILNKNKMAVEVSVEVFDHMGQLKAQRVFELPPNGRRVDLLDGSGFFGPDFEQVKGYIQISSTEKVTAFAIYGDFQGEFLSAIEGQNLLP